MRKLIKVAHGILFPVISYATAIFALWINYSFTEADNNLKEQIALVDLSIKEEQNERDKVHAERDLYFKIYEMLRESILEKDQSKQELIKEMIIIMVEDSLIRKKLLKILELSGTPEIRKDTTTLVEKEENFEIQQSSINLMERQEQDSEWRSWNYDIFWCETSGNRAELQANNIVSKLKSIGAKGRLRVRELPASINVRVGYGISGYVIRRSNDEIAQATALQKLLREILLEDGHSVYFRQQHASQKTQWYISAFICPSY